MSPVSLESAIPPVEIVVSSRPVTIPVVMSNAGLPGPAGPPGPQGAAGSGISFKGSVATEANLPFIASGPSRTKAGDAYLVAADDSLWIFDGTDYVSGGSIQGPPGVAGAAGPAGADGQPRQIWDESTPLPVRSALNFIGGGVTVVDNSGANSTEVMINALPMTRNSFIFSVGVAAGAEVDYDFSFYSGFRLIRLQASQAARLRIYASSGQRTADAARAPGTDPDPATDHGVLLDFVLPATDLDWALTPAVDIHTGSGSTTVPMRVKNNGSSPNVTFTVTYVRTE